MDELHRICASGAKLHVRVPFWNSEIVAVDPTHVRGFSEKTFGFFDPDNELYVRRPYYAAARFQVESVAYRVKYPFEWRSYVVRAGWRKHLAHLLAGYLSNVIWELHVELVAIKSQM